MNDATRSWCGRGAGALLALALAAGACAGAAWGESIVARQPGAAHAGAPQHAPGYLGIAFADVPPEQAAAMHLKQPCGAEVAFVDHDAPAGKAGLKPHDIVIAVNGHAVDGASTLERLIHEAGAGGSITLAVMRNGAEMTLTAKLADREQVERAALQRLASNAPPPPMEAEGFDATYAAPLNAPPADAPSRTQSFISTMLHTGPFTGMAVQAMEPQLAVYFGAPQGMGLLVNTVMANSPASNAGLRAGDVVLRADGVAMHSTSDWTRHLHAGKGSPVTLVVLRDKHEQILSLVPDLKHRSAVEARPVVGGVVVVCA